MQVNPISPIRSIWIARSDLWQVQPSDLVIRSEQGGLASTARALETSTSRSKSPLDRLRVISRYRRIPKKLLRLPIGC